MKNLSAVFLWVVVFLSSAVVTSHAAIVPGLYFGGPDTIVTIESDENGLFGVGDVAYGVRADGLITSASIRIVEDVVSPFVYNSGYLERTVVSTRQGTAIIAGQVYGEPGKTYTTSFTSIATMTQYLVNAGGNWVFHHTDGTSVNNGIFNEEPFAYTSTYEFTYDNNDFSGPEGSFRTLTFNQSLITNKISAVPVPGTMLLLGMGIVGLAGLRRKQ